MNEAKIKELHDRIRRCILLTDDDLNDFAMQILLSRDHQELITILRDIYNAGRFRGVYEGRD